MKIISKYKDYYDYLQGIYGVDEKLVLDRRADYIIKPEVFLTSYKRKISFHIGEYKIDCLVFNNQFYFGEELLNFKISEPLSFKIPNENQVIVDVSNTRYHDYLFFEIKPLYLGDKSPTWKQDCPILLNGKRGYNDEFTKYPILSNFNLQKIIPPHDVWIYLSEWLSKKITKDEPTVPVGDDKTRILNAGFDLKISFRG